MADPTATAEDLLRAAEILRIEAACLLECHAPRGDWTGEPEAHADFDEWNALAAKLQALAATKAEAWRPIVTAPLDGTTVLLGRDMGEFGFVRGYGHFDGKPGTYLSGWITQGFDPVVSNLGLAHPTVWQPLPGRPTPSSPPAPREKTE